MANSVQIDKELFFDLYDYIVEQEDYESIELCNRMREKIDRMIDRELFTMYKRAATPAEREAYRKKYLDRRGIGQSFRTEREVPTEEL